MARILPNDDDFCANSGFLCQSNVNRLTTTMSKNLFISGDIAGTIFELMIIMQIYREMFAWQKRFY
jgi:hypothetical protein